VTSEKGAVNDHVRRAIGSVAPLVHGHLTGNPLTCSWCGEPAVSLLLLGPPVCAAHAAEDLPVPDG
jgi:hypothetical protein